MRYTLEVPQLVKDMQNMVPGMHDEQQIAADKTRGRRESEH